VIEGDQKWLAEMLVHVPELARGVTEAYQGIIVQTFEKAKEHGWTVVSMQNDFKMVLDL